jgi:EF-P beta-lysylation protein EpmB
MIAATTPASQFDRPPQRWQQLLADAVSSPEELCQLLDLDISQLPGALRATQEFPLRIPRGYVSRMRRADPQDPLLLQVLPTGRELELTPGFTADPVGDLNRRAAPGLLHKYAGRALLVATGACAVHCRYCFRRHFPYAEESAASQSWQPALNALRADPSISEVILSGGDPWSLSDRRLRQLTDALLGIAHIRRLRIHTRYPIVLPERIDHGLLQWLADLPLQKVVVIHANHAQEIDDSVRHACRQLAAAGATLLNQSVLLAGVNDTVDALADLSASLFGMQVLPYYLHLLDRVQGAAHFDVSEAVAVDLHAQLAARLPGYLVPRLVREVPGAPAKTPIATRV